MEKKGIDDDDDAPKPAFIWDGNDPVARRSLQKTIAMVYVTAAAAALMFLGTLARISDGGKETTITMDLASFDATDGLDMDAKTVGHTVSPAFNLAVRVENPRYFRRWCANSGEVVVYYSGIALAWGKVPGFCARRRSAAEFTVVPWGRGVGLPEDLRRRLTSEWKNGTAQVLAEMKLYSYVHEAFDPRDMTVFGASSLTIH